MPTQEERLTTVEYNLKQFKTETVKAYQDIATELAMVKGLCVTSVERLMTLRTTLDEHTNILNNHTTRLDRLETKADEHTRILDEHTTRFDRLETLLTQILARLPEKP